MLHPWINQPSILEIITMDDVQILCGEFLCTNIGLERPATYELEEWNKRKLWANKFARAICQNASNPEMVGGWRCFAYRPFGKLVGLMSWEPFPLKKTAVVRNLAIRPGRESRGAILIEKAVNLSEEAEYKGCVNVPLAENVENKPLWPGSRDIIPGESHEWVKVDGVWRLKRLLIEGWPQRIMERELFGRLHPQPFPF